MRERDSGTVEAWAREKTGTWARRRLRGASAKKPRAVEDEDTDGGSHASVKGAGAGVSLGGSDRAIRRRAQRWAGVRGMAQAGAGEERWAGLREGEEKEGER